MEWKDILKPFNGPGWFMRLLVSVLLGIACWHFTKVDAALNTVIAMQGSIGSLTVQITELNNRLRKLEEYYIDDLRRRK